MLIRGKEVSFTEVQRAYIAGLLDGEGTFSAGEKANECEYYARIAIFNTDLKVLNWIRKTVGCGWVGKGSGAANRDRIVYCWSVSGKEAEPIVEALQPYLHIKKRQSKAWIAFRRTFGTRQSTHLPDHIKSKRRALIRKIQALNQKGRSGRLLTPPAEKLNERAQEPILRSDSPTLREISVSE